MAINVRFEDEHCPLCHEEIKTEFESADQPHEFECDCGAKMTIEFEGTLSMKTRGGKRRSTSLSEKDKEAK